MGGTLAEELRDLRDLGIFIVSGYGTELEIVMK